MCLLRRKAYFLDHEKGSRYFHIFLHTYHRHSSIYQLTLVSPLHTHANNARWQVAPSLIKHERPVSPTTMARRLRSEDKKCEKHVVMYEKACARNETYLQTKRGGLWQVLEEDATMIRQMIILRDVIYCVLSTLSTRRREGGERPTNKRSILPQGGPKGPHPSIVQPPATARDNKSTPPDVTPQLDENGEVIVASPKARKKKTNRYKRGESTGDGLKRSDSSVTVDSTGTGMGRYSHNLLNAFIVYFIYPFIHTLMRH